MPVDLENQVREYAEFLRETAGIVEPDVVVTRIPMATPPRFRPRALPISKRRGPAVAVASFVAVLILGGVALLFTGSDQETPVATTEAPTTTATPTTTIAPIATTEAPTTTATPTTTIAAVGEDVDVYDLQPAVRWRWDEGAQVVFLTEPTAPLDLTVGDGTGLFSHSGVRVFDTWRSAVIPENSPYLDYVTDAAPESDITPTVEMVWLSWRHNDGTPEVTSEIQAVVERRARSGHFLHPECYVSGEGTHAVAVVDANLEPVVAWKVGPDYGSFEPVEASLVVCESVITVGSVPPDWAIERDGG